jgi:hypothetical protein
VVRVQAMTDWPTMRRGLLLFGALALLAACTTDNRSSPTTTLPTTTLPTTTTSTTVAPTTVRPTTAPPTTVAPTTAAPTTVAATTTTAAPTTTTIPAGRALVLGENGIGSAQFGADPDAVVDYVSSIIGRPTTDSGWADPSAFGACPGTVVRAVSWRDLTLYFGDQSEGGRRRFFGDTYGPPFSTSIDPAGVATDAGLTIGSTVGALRTAYPTAGIEPATDTAPANFTIVEGLSGYLTGTADTDLISQFVGGLVCGQ